VTEEPEEEVHEEILKKQARKITEWVPSVSFISTRHMASEVVLSPSGT
jgi:hypothetical protein